VGKTTTLAKVAALARYRKRSKKVALISTDDRRICGARQLETYAEILCVPFRMASGRKALREALRDFSGFDLMLVDTAGIPPGDNGGIAELQQLLEGIQGLERHLLISATTKDEDQDRIVGAFGALPTDRLIFTKVDETVSHGAILNRLIRSDAPVSYFTRGPRVPEDIEVVTPEKIVELVLTRESRDAAWSDTPERLAEEMEAFERRIAEVSAEHAPPVPARKAPRREAVYDRRGRSGIAVAV
jgi:flagellar biosynthesis protein FlhF